MFWQDDNEEQYTVSDEIVDLVCTIRCRSLPNDHAQALAEALLEHAAWLATDAGAGVHPISIQEAANGWMRPEGPDELIHLSRRTKLILRAPQQRLADSEELIGKPLEVDGNPFEIQKIETRQLQPSETLFSRYNIVAEGQDEDDFLQAVFDALKAMGISPRKMLPGKGRRLRGPDGVLHTSSLMVAELRPEESITLQQRGIGEHQHLGCGLFIPHKGIREVHDLEG
jgi:CRISPR-associated protein Cas6